MKKITTICILILTSINILAQSSETLSHTASWSETLEKAQKENKLIFVDCYFTGCHPCAQMDREVFPNAIVRDDLEKNFIAIKVDVFKEKLGDTLNLKYGVSGFPTFLVLNKDGRLISMFVGYQDPPALISKLSDAKAKASRNEYMQGFAISNQLAYPDFYLGYYDREDRKSDPAAANKWIKAQNNWADETVALPILRTGKLDIAVEDYLLENYTTFINYYGSALLIEKVSSILNARLKTSLGKQNDEQKFRQFLTGYSKSFPSQDWKIYNFLLGYTYYGSIAKDTTALLRFMNEEPVVYMNYFGALYNNMVARKQLTDINLPLLASWVDKAVTENDSFDLLRTAASIHRMHNNTEGARRFIMMALEKAKKFNMPVEGYEKQLSSLQ